VLTRHRSTVSLVLALSILVGACASPVGVARVDPSIALRELTASALSRGEPSLETQNVLYEQGLARRFAQQPEAALADLHDAVVSERRGASAVFALAELSFSTPSAPASDRTTSPPRSTPGRFSSRLSPAMRRARSIADSASPPICTTWRSPGPSRAQMGCTSSRAAASSRSPSASWTSPSTSRRSSGGAGNSPTSCRSRSSTCGACGSVSPRRPRGGAGREHTARGSGPAGVRPGRAAGQGRGHRASDHRASAGGAARGAPAGPAEGLLCENSAELATGGKLYGRARDVHPNGATIPVPGQT
jgi:hypothetical protein